MKILFLIALILAIHFLLNIIRLMSTLRYYRKFKRKDKDLSQCRPFVERLFDKAGVNECLAATRYGGHKISYVLSNYDFIGLLEDTFQLAIGTYRFRILNTFNPTYWIDLPQRILENSRLKYFKINKTIFSVLFWIAGIIAAYLIEKTLDLFLAEKLSSILESLLK